MGGNPPPAGSLQWESPPPPNAADPEAGHSAAVDRRMQAEASLVLQGKI